MSRYVHVSVFNAPGECQPNSPVIRHTAWQWDNFPTAFRYVKQSNQKICQTCYKAILKISINIFVKLKKKKAISEMGEYSHLRGKPQDWVGVCDLPSKLVSDV